MACWLAEWVSPVSREMISLYRFLMKRRLHTTPVVRTATAVSVSAGGTGGEGEPGAEQIVSGECNASLGREVAPAAKRKKLKIKQNNAIEAPPSVDNSNSEGSVDWCLMLATGARNTS